MEIDKIYETMDYGPAPENEEVALDYLNAHHRKFDLFIDGEWQEPSSKVYFESVNPADNNTLAEVSEADASDVDQAVQAASKALSGWEDIGCHARARYLYALARQIQKHARLFAVLESLDNGKPIRETRDIDIPLVVRHFYHHAGWAQLRDVELKDYQSVGVVGQIIPWNFPLLMLSWKIAPALAMGNTVVLKPAEFTSLTALLFAEICQQINFPKGVVNIITGHGETGAALVNHQGVNKIAFTGSTEVGRIIRKATAGSRKKLSLELGGKSPFIVFEDSDLDSAVEGIVDAIWFNQGQVCCAGSRLLVEESIAEKLYSKIRARMEKLRMGNPLDKGIDIGAIVAPVQLKVIEDLVKLGVEEGSTLWQPSWSCPTEGCFFPPTLFTDVTPSSTIAQEEIFGPVLVAMSFRTHKEAVKLANNTRFGLACSIWTENINLALDLAPQIKAGTVWINCTNVFDAASGFGGYRESGFGREGGREGLFEYVKEKAQKKWRSEAFKTELTMKQSHSENGAVGIDRTAKLYIGGQQIRPDNGYSIKVYDKHCEYIGEVSSGNRKDVRNAVEAAHSNEKWSGMTGHARAQVLYYIAENLEQRKTEFSGRLELMCNVSPDVAQKEVDLSIERMYYYAAMADKYDGRVHHTTLGNVTMAMPEPIGVMALICPNESPLLGLVSLLFPSIAMGNSVIVVPSENAPFSAIDFYQVLETSDVPRGTVNIITGKKDVLTEVLSKHDDVDGIWYHGDEEGSKKVEYLSADNMKRTWVNHGKYLDWTDPCQGQGEEFIRRAIEIKNIWIPYGV